jgi:hypothetical protein
VVSGCLTVNVAATPPPRTESVRNIPTHASRRCRFRQPIAGWWRESGGQRQLEQKQRQLGGGEPQPQREHQREQGDEQHQRHDRIHCGLAPTINRTRAMLPIRVRATAVAIPIEV